MDRLNGKAVLLAGGTGRQGTAVARLFAAEGASLCIAARHGAEELARSLSPCRGAVITGIDADLTEFPQVERVVARAVESMGRIDILYNNLGGYIEPGESLDEWDRLIATNLRSHFLAIKAVAPIMKAQGGGAIIEVAAARLARLAGGASYGASKGGIIAMAQGFGHRLRDANIRVNVIAPNNIGESPHPERPGLPSTRLKRKGQPEDVAYAALYLASDEAAFVSGAVLVVDGGRDLR